MPPATISVILATYNGARYLQQQLESLAQQTSLPTELLVGDDGSQDETRSVVDTFTKTCPFAVRWIQPSKERLGACANFARLLEYASGDYLMFCDQDDIWLPDKTSMVLKEMQRLEEQYGRDIPCLVHTDLKVITESGAEIASSFWRYQRIMPQLANRLQVVLVQNLVTGCTMMLNRSAVRMVVPMPFHGPLMHDWWCTLAVVAFGGQVSGLAYPRVCYRQHGGNVVGAQSWWQRILDRLFVVSGRNIRDELLATQQQAAIFFEQFGGILTPQNKNVIRDYARLSDLGFFAKRSTLLRHGIHKSGWYRTLGLYLYV